MAEALEALYPGINLVSDQQQTTDIVYDVDTGDINLTPADLPKIEEKMLELAKTKSQYIRQEVAKADAIKYFTERRMNTN